MGRLRYPCFVHLQCVVLSFFFLLRYVISSELGMDDGGISVSSDRMCTQKDNREATFVFFLCLPCLAVLSPLDTAQLSFHRISISLLVPKDDGA